MAILLGLAAAISFAALPPGTAAAATFTVNSAADVNDLTPGNGRCVAYLIVFPPFVLPFCTLRAAIQEANALPGPDRIILPGAAFRLDIVGANEDAAASGDLDITDTLILEGAGADETVINGGGIDRVIDLIGAETEATLSGLTIENGSLPQGLGEAAAGGGGIRSSGVLTLNGIRLWGNAVNGCSAADVGGGLCNSGTCSLRDSTVAQNRAAGGGGIANLAGGIVNIQASTIHANQAIRGAGILNEGSGAVVNSTISGNRAQEATFSRGGGIVNRGQLDLWQSTIANNLAVAAGGGISNEGSVSMINTLLAGNSGGNCDLSRRLFSQGYNLDSDNSCGFILPTDLRGLDPKLDSLAPHGGPTDTHGLLLGSPAVDRGQDLRPAGITTDQRGIPRPLGRGFDIGAFETGPRSVVPLLAPLLFQETSAPGH